MIAKICAGVIAVVILVPVLVGDGVAGMIPALFGGGGSQPSQNALADIPPDYLALYREAAGVCPKLDWTILAAIGKIETNHGRSTLPGVSSGQNSAGAGGPMQFLQSTFDSVVARHPLPPGGATPPSRYNPHDAIYAAAYYLCDSGAGRGDVDGAIFAYNHAQWYVNEVLAQAQQYADAAATVGTGDCNAIQATNSVALAAINYACGQRGLRYVWGGDGPGQGDQGFDCSGLTQAAYSAAGLRLPRTANAQFHAGPIVPAGQTLLPGDLVFYGTAAFIHHVGLYIGGGLMIDAPYTGQVIRIEPYRWKGDGYFGATRPAGSAAS